MGLFIYTKLFQDPISAKQVFHVFFWCGFLQSAGSFSGMTQKDYDDFRTETKKTRNVLSWQKFMMLALVDTDILLGFFKAI